MKKNVFLLVILVIVVAFLINGCKPAATPTVPGAATPVNNSPIYTAGSYSPDGLNNIACYWKGTQKTDLPGSGADDNVYSIYVSGNTVYTAGYYDNNSYLQPCYWTGTTQTILPCAGYNGYAYSMSVSNGTVYTAGSYNDGIKLIPCYWTDTSKQDLAGDGADDAEVLSICVSGGIIYTGGYYNDGTINIPCYWTGTTRTDLPGNTNGSRANAICVSNGIIYAAGFYNTGDFEGDFNPCYWTVTGTGSAIVTDLPGDTSSASAYSIDVANGIINICGFYDLGLKSIPCYWTAIGANPVKTDLTTSAGAAETIFVKNGVTYIVGYHYNGSYDVPCYWTGTTETDLQGSTNGAWAYAIYVQ